MNNNIKIIPMVTGTEIQGELDELGIPHTSHTILQDKDGITVARIVSNADSYILKTFQKKEHRREIENYRLLTSFGIPTIRVIASTESALLLEDLDNHPIYRLGTEEDMSDPQVAKDKTSAFMFDYNLLGKGYAYSDVSNVTFSLSEEAGMAFLKEYGEFDPAEKALHDVVSMVVSLYMACQREELPWWAQEMLEELDTTLIDKITTLRKYL